MFGWFRPQCPVDLPEKVWVEKRMTWLTQVFGPDRLLGTVVLPTPEFFPDTFSGQEDDVQPLLERVCKFMGVDPRRLTLGFFDEEENSALGVYLGGPPEQVLINRSQLADPLSLVATLAHEVAHALLLGDQRISVEAADHELVTDLLTVFLGLGVFGSACVIREAQWRHTAMYYAWQVGKQGYLSEKMYGYALALFARARCEASPTWAKHLRLNVRGVFSRALTYLTKTGDTLFSARQSPGVTSIPDLKAALWSPSAGTRLAALWDLKARARQVEGAETFLSMLKDSEPSIRREAADILIGLGYRAKSCCEQLLEAAQLETDPHARQLLIAATGEAGGLAQDVIPVLIHLVQKEPSHYSVQDFAVAGEDSARPKEYYFSALARFGAEAASAISVLIEGLEDCDEVALEAVRALAAIGPPAKEALPRLLDILQGEDGVLRGECAAAVARIAPDSPAVVRALRKALRDDSPGRDIRVEAAEALATMGAAARPAVKELEALAATADRMLRLHAGYALARVDNRVTDAERIFREALPKPLGMASPSTVDEEAEIYAFVEARVVDLGAGAVPVLRSYLRESDPDARCFAAWALAQVGPPAKEVVPDLSQALSEPEPLVRIMTSCALEILEGQTPLVSRTLTNVLGMAFEESPSAGSGCGSSSPAAYRELIPQMLRSLGLDAVPSLIESLAGATEPLRAEIVQVLGTVAPKTPATTEALKQALTTASGTMRADLEKALRHREALPQAVALETLRRLSYPPQVPADEAPDRTTLLRGLMSDMVAGLTPVAHEPCARFEGTRTKTSQCT